MTKFNLDKLREIAKPRELSRAEEMALNAYPDEMVTTLARGNKFRAGPIYRKGFVQGYEQAEKDLGLTRDDIDELVHIYEVRKSVSADFDKEFYEDILNEYNRRKNNE